MSKINEVIPMNPKNGTSFTEGVSTVSLTVDTSSASHVQHTVMSFHDVNYTVNLRTGITGKCKKAKEKQVLSNVSGIMKPGLNAIMGPTGSGKSSLLDILAGRKDPAGLSGNVLINSRPLPSNFKRISGYVVQQDIVIGTLTVRENLWFSANLRLPRSVSNKDKKKRIQEILYDLGLTMCADTKIGNEMIRGVSGGEKKRASIGMELITAPTVLFLDEPTTGLDASTANSVMFLLKRLGNKGRTIILSIHQPRYSIFRQFDTLTLLSLGRLIYHGPNEKVLPHFDALGYHCEEHNNPADFFLDVINGDSTALSNDIDQDNPEMEETSDETSKSMAEQLSDHFAKSEIFSTTQQELKEIYSNFQGSKKKVAFEGKSAYATPFYYQFGVLSKRAFQNVIRNPLASVGTLVLNLIVGVVFGLLYYQVDDSPDTGTQNRFGVLFFITTNLLFGSISAIEIFVKEKEIFVHEYVSGYYRVISYFLAKLVADLIPMRTISPIIFCSVTYWMVGLKADPASFFTFVLLVLLTGYAAVSIALFFSASFNSFAVASIFISLTFVFSILFAGLLVNVDTILPWLAWIKYLSVAQYAFSGLCVNEFRNSVYQTCAESNSTRLPSSVLQVASSLDLQVSIKDNLTCYSITGEEFLSSRLGIGSVDPVSGVVSISDWDQWVNVVALSCISLGMLTLTYIQLMRTKTMT